MKFPLLTALVAGAAILEATAAPLRVVVVTSNQDVTIPVMRFGHAAAIHNNNNQNGPVARLSRPGRPDGGMRRPCTGGGARVRFRQKAIEISNAFRKALGLQVIEGDAMPAVNYKHSDGMVHILPFVGNLPGSVPTRHPGNGPEQGYTIPVFAPHPHPHHRPQSNHGRFRKHMESAPFMERLHFALMALGPWEGRAVAFVLGCGIGVLLRMLWVLSVISYRFMKGGQEDENKYLEIAVIEDFADAEEIFVAPPTYTYPDEKADKDKAVVVTETAE